MFRVRTYEAARRQSMLSLGERLKTNLIAGNDVDSEDVEKFASRYVELGGKQQNFNRWMMNLHTNANTSQSEQLRASLTDPFSYKVQLLMGGDDE
jgi:glucuronate isomerase